MLLNYQDNSKVVIADGSRRDPTLPEVFRRFFLIFFDPTTTKAWRIDSNPRNIASTASRYHLITAMKIAFLFRGGDINEWIEQTPKVSSPRRVRKYRTKAVKRPEIFVLDSTPISMDFNPVIPQTDNASTPFDIRRKRKAGKQGKSGRGKKAIVLSSEEEAQFSNGEEVVTTTTVNIGSSTGTAGARGTRNTNPLGLTEVQKWKIEKDRLLAMKWEKGHNKPMIVEISAGMNAIMFDDDKPTTAESEELDLAGHSEEDLSSESDDQ